jgi:acetyl-CoA carboxylase biotin carboxyl carrier protein
MNTDGLKQILAHFESSRMTQLKYTDGTVQLELRKGQPSVATEGALLPSTPESALQVPTRPNDHPSPASTITSPIAGIFYASPAPGESAFIEVGKPFEAGQTIAVIEAMKLFNPIEAEVSGTVTKILVEDGESVDRGTPLFEVRS